MVNGDVALEVIQQIMGHKDFNSTLIYARVRDEKLKEAVKVCDRKKVNS
jgi:site-specific recombinase XerD